MEVVFLINEDLDKIDEEVFVFIDEVVVEVSVVFFLFMDVLFIDVYNEY